MGLFQNPGEEYQRCDLSLEVSSEVIQSTLTNFQLVSTSWGSYKTTNLSKFFENFQRSPHLLPQIEFAQNPNCIYKQQHMTVSSSDQRGVWVWAGGYQHALDIFISCLLLSS